MASPCVSGWMAAVAAVLPCVASGEPPIDIGSRLELFVDRFLIDRLDGAALRLHSPVPREVVFVFDKPYEQAQSGYMTMLKDGDQYRMYYLAGGDLTHECACVAFSRDGIHWERPNLGLFEVNAIWKGKERTGDEAHNFSPFIDANPAAVHHAALDRLGTGPWVSEDASCRPLSDDCVRCA